MWDIIGVGQNYIFDDIVTVTRTAGSGLITYFRKGGVFMKGSVTIGKINNIRIEINASWLVGFVLITLTLALGYFPQAYKDWPAGVDWILGALMAIMLFVSVILHELAHSLVSKNLGIDVKRITLFIFGGMAEMDNEPDSPDKELKIAIAGPTMSIFLFVVFLALSRLFESLSLPEYTIVFFSYLSSINLFLGIFNLIPAFPLDGGRVMRAIVWKRKGSLRNATKITAMSGRMFGYILIFLGIFIAFWGNFIGGIWLLFLGFFINNSASASYQSTLLSDIFKKTTVQTFMTEHVVIVDDYISVRDFVDRYLLKYKFTVFPVRRMDEIVGILSVENIKGIPADRWDMTVLRGILTPLSKELSVRPEETMDTVMNKIFGNRFGRVLVMKDGELSGIISRTDILNYLRIHQELDL